MGFHVCEMISDAQVETRVLADSGKSVPFFGFSFPSPQ